MMPVIITVLVLGFHTGIFAGQDADQRLHYNAESLEHLEIDGEPVEKFDKNVVFWQGDMTLYTQQALHYPKRSEYHLMGPVTMIDDTDTLKCQSMIYHNDLNRLQAFENVQFTQIDQTISCDSLFYWTEQDSGVAMGNVHLNHPERFLNAERFIYRKTDGFRGLSFRAEGQAQFGDGPRTIAARIIEYDDLLQQMTMNLDCSVTQDGQGLLGDSITIQYQDSVVQELSISGDAAAYNDLHARIRQEYRELQVFRDQMGGNELGAWFENNRIQRLKLMGMAATEYHVVQDSLLHGVNEASGDTIEVTFDDAVLDRIQVFGGGRGEFIPEGPNTKVDSVVTYRAEYMDYHVNDRMTFLEKGAEVKYQGTQLTSGKIQADWKVNILSAETLDDEVPTVSSTDSDPMSGSFMEFDLITKHGRVTTGKTRFNDGNYYGREVYRDEPNIYHVDHSIYTTCDAENPHFCFISRHMKMIADDKVVAKPLVLVIFDIPIIGIPFAVFPNKGGGRRSGWIMPNFGHSSGNGTYFSGLGYYWAPNDYADLKTQMNFRDRKGLDLKSHLNYKKRYSITGSVDLTVYRSILENEIKDLFTSRVNQNWILKWTHSQEIDPTQRISVNANYTTSNTINQDNGWDLQTRLQQQLISNASYSKTWIGTKNSFSVNLSETYDLQAENKRPDELSTNSDGIYYHRTRTLPGMTFKHSKSQLFGSGSNSKWYHSIYWDYTSNYYGKQKIGLLTETDSTWVDDEYDTQYNYYLRHNSSLSMSETFGGWLTVSPSIRLTEDWIFKYREALVDSVGEFVNTSTEYREVSGFLPRHKFTTSLATSTKIYGIFPMEIGRLTALRHVITPSLTFSWSPDLSKPLFGYQPNYFQEDAAGDLYDKFTGSEAGTTSRSETQSVSIRLANEFQAKLRTGEDGYEKLNLLTWDVRTSYNAMADSLKLSPLSSSLRTTIPGGLILRINMTHDPYVWERVNTADSDAEPAYSMRRMDRFAELPRLTDLDINTSFSLKGGKFEPPQESAVSDTLTQVLPDLESELEPTTTNSAVPKISRSSLWAATLGLSYSRSQNRSGADIQKDRTFWVNTNLKLNLTQNWTVNYNARFDLESNELVSHSFDIYRPLHCWEFRLQWWPSGVGRGFMLKINVMNPDLRDIKLKSTGGRLSSMF